MKSDEVQWTLEKMSTISDATARDHRCTIRSSLNCNVIQ